MPAPSSWPCSGSPASRRKRVARAESGGRDPGVEQRLPARARPAAAGTWSSTPSSPVYPVPATQPRSRRTRAARPRSARPSASVGARRSRAAPAPRDPAPRGPPASAVTSSIAHSPRAVEQRGLTERVDERRGVRRVGHHQEVARCRPPHDDVVDDVRVVGIEQVRVLRATGTDAVEIVGERPLQRGERAGAVHVHRPEVRHVEHDGAARDTRDAPRARRCTGSASPSHRTAPCARRGRGAARRAASGARGSLARGSRFGGGTAPPP